MPISEAAHELFDAMDTHDLDTLAAIFHDDLQLTVNDAATMDKAGVLALQKAYFDAFSDWTYNFSAAAQSDNVVTVNYAITGTHDGALDLQTLGYDIQAEATSKSIALPESTATAMFDDNGLVIAMNLQQAEGAGMVGILGQLGIEPPAVG